MVLPFLKLGTLVLKTLSKPIAGRLKKEAGLHPRFRQFIVSMAQLSKALGVLGPPVNKAAVFGDKIFGPQANHRLTTTMQRRIYGHATDVEIRPLNEEKAVQAAVDLMGNSSSSRSTTREYLHCDNQYVLPLHPEFLVPWANASDSCIFESAPMPDKTNNVAGVALIFEVQRSSRSEAKKEELRKQEMEGLRLRDEQLAGEVELLKQKLEEIEQLARARGLAGVFNLRQAPAEDSKSGKKLA
ncbi:hypothetical protein C3L33_06195, partial [Rhododendron williamsianum]